MLLKQTKKKSEWICGTQIQLRFYRWIATWSKKINGATAFMKGEFGKEWVHVYGWLRPFGVHLKLSRLLISYTPRYNKKLKPNKNRNGATQKNISITNTMTSFCCCLRFWILPYGQYSSMTWWYRLTRYSFVVLLQLFSCSVVSDSATPWTVVRQAPLSMGFPRREYWSGLPFSSPGDLPNPEIKPRSPAWQADSLYH